MEKKLNKKEREERIKNLEHLREDWFNLFGYESDINQRIIYEMDRI